MNAHKTVACVLTTTAGLLLTACLARPEPKAQQTIPIQASAAVTEVTGAVTSSKQSATSDTTEAEFRSKDPKSLNIAMALDPDSLDPALAYEVRSGEIIQNVYETLIFFNRQDPAHFVPQLAEAVPSLENGGISADGLQYTFQIRRGVRFQNGDILTPSDVAYSFQRGLLQGGTNSPQWLLTEPFFGFGVDDVAVLVETAQLFGSEALDQPIPAEQQDKLTGVFYDDRERLATIDPDLLRAVCKRVKAAIVADDQAGTVTFHLTQPWGPFLATLAGSWGSILDQQWVAANEGWDGSCETWQNFYAMVAEQNPINAIANGTGPFQLEYWRPGDEITLVRNPYYWRSEPAWSDGPSGPASFERVVIKISSLWNFLISKLTAGDLDLTGIPTNFADFVEVQLVGEICEYSQAANDFIECQPSNSPSQPVRIYRGAPQVAKTSILFNFDIRKELEGENYFIGSGQMDGKGIPTDFFSDLHIRKAFNYCFDLDTLIQEALSGEAIPNIGIPLPGMIGYEPDGLHYSYDLAKCEAEFKASNLHSAEGKSLWETGFYFQYVYNAESYYAQTIIEILTQSLAAVNQKFKVEALGLPLPTYVRYSKAGYLPLFFAGWLEDIHDPHNWYKPYLDGVFSTRQALPEELRASFRGLIQSGVLETDPTRRQVIYQQLNQQVYDAAPAILLQTSTNRVYVQRWVQGLYANPLYSGLYYYALSKQ